jgi:hypothetical protein
VLWNFQMLPTHKKLPLILFCAVPLLARQPAAATLVDWDTLGWTPGSLSNSYDIDPNKTGNDLTFTLSDNVNTFTNDATSGVQTPAITMSLAGGVAGSKFTPTLGQSAIEHDNHLHRKFFSTILSGCPGCLFFDFRYRPGIRQRSDQQYIRDRNGWEPRCCHDYGGVGGDPVWNRPDSTLSWRGQLA